MRDRSSRVLCDRYGVVLLLVGVALVGVAFAYVIANEANPKSGTIRFEFYRLLVQALLIGAVGAFLSAAIQEDRRRRAAEERSRGFTRDRIESILRDLDEDYRLIKRSRRMLRLESPIRHSLYRTEMTNLEDIQRSLEEVHTNIRNLESISKLDLAGVTKSVDGMTTYLDELWKEYEGTAPRTNEEFAPESVRELRDFVAPVEKGSFKWLKKYYRAARNDLTAQMARLAGVPNVPLAAKAERRRSRRGRQRASPPTGPAMAQNHKAHPNPETT